MKNIFLLIIFLTGFCLGQTKTFTNPILSGFYPDPSICKAGDDYYLVNSTFSYYPGIPVFHSKDLINWKLINYAMRRPEQINLDSLGVSRGIFAPAIMYNDGTFYVTCTLVDAGGNFVVTAKDPAGEWSNPYWIPEINGIDPSMFFDEDGKVYVLYNSIAPDDKPVYNGHRTIRMCEFDLNTMKVKGEEQILVNGGTDISKKPIWIEGPHIFRKEGYYYLIAAEGGTGDYHSEVVFRSKNINGPYVSYENNPILTQRHLDPEREYPITSTGHADFVETADGNWWAVFLGCRPYKPYKEGYYNTGRETFLAPVKWENGWPVITKGDDLIKYEYPVNSSDEIQNIPYSGNFTYKDEFNSEELNLNWMFLRNVREKWYSLKEKEGCLSLKLRPETCSGNMNPSFVAHRQQHQTGSVTTSMNFQPASEKEKAGLLVFQNEKYYYLLCKTLENNKPVISLFKSSNDGKEELLAKEEIKEDGSIGLKIESNGNTYAFYYSTDPAKWEKLKNNVDATFLSTRTAGGFVGCMYALYGTSSGEASQSKAWFDWFEYSGSDEVYKGLK